jgi:hypothetical protein
VDSVQKTRTDTSGEAETAKSRVDDVIATVKQAASLFGHVVIVTSEINRSAYRNKDANQNVEDIAAAKESGDIEYGVKLLLVLKEGKEEDCIDVSTPKNRLGRGRPRWRLKWDHVRATFTEVAMLPVDERAKVKADEDKIKRNILTTLQSMPGRLGGKNAIIDAMQHLGCGADRQKILAALRTLEFELKIGKQNGFYAVQQSGT